MQTTEYIGHPELLSSATLPELRRLVGQCPYYQAARLLLLENLFMLHEPDFDKELRAAALCVPDRSVIFDLVESLNYQIDVAAKDVEEEPLAPTGDRVTDLIDNYLRQMGHTSVLPAQGVIDPVSDYMSMVAQLDDAPGTEGEDTEWPMSFQTGDTERDAAAGSIESDAAAAEAVQEGADGDVAESLAATNDDAEAEEGTEMPAPQEENAGEMPAEYEENALTEQNEDATDEEEDDAELQENENAEANDSNALREEYFTETLAKVFIKQGNYERAIEILTKINLVNPRKNAYFADQIRFLQKLVVNNKHKK